jgi:DNA helicase-2/ATP-dependent DNA helicase PcrA
MQKIYLEGAGVIEAAAGWEQITKPENFRCPQRVLQVVNAIREPDDGLSQTRGRMNWVDGNPEPVMGSARFFLLRADDHRSVKLAKVREWMRRANDDDHWVSDDPAADFRVLVVVHRMAAARLGFPNLYAALNDNDAPPSIKEGLKDGTAWPLRPFLTYLLPLATAVAENRKLDVMTFLRSECPLLQPTALISSDPVAVLRALQASTTELARLIFSSDALLQDVLVHSQAAGLLQLDEAWAKYLSPDRAADDDDPEIPAVSAFLHCGVGELAGYRHYLEDLSPFATQQGVKGAEFERVLVLIDDEEGRGQRQFSYEKYFGIVAPSDTDMENLAEGKDSVMDRTRRLFYVCCSRATKDLAIVMFVQDIENAREKISETGIFESDDIVDEETLEATLT